MDVSEEDSGNDQFLPLTSDFSQAGGRKKLCKIISSAWLEAFLFGLTEPDFTPSLGSLYHDKLKDFPNRRVKSFLQTFRVIELVSYPWLNT